MKKRRLLTAIKVALLVGTILNLINNIDPLIREGVSSALVIKIIVTYHVPFFVSYYSAWRAQRFLEQANQSALPGNAP